MPSSSASPQSAAVSHDPQRPSDRAAVLADVLDPRRLPTPPTVAMSVVSAASRPNCNPDEIITLLSQDPALCGKMLKAVNSCVYGLSRPISSLARAVAVLGLGPIRSLALGLSLPAMKVGRADPATRNYQITSIAGAIIARDLSARVNRSGWDDDMAAALLRDIGTVLLGQTYPGAWARMTETWGDRLLTETCEAELETFGIDHADVSAELLGQWNLPDEIVKPIRFHHDPKRLVGEPKELVRRAELLYFAGLLANLDTVIRHPHVYEFVLNVARTRYDLPKPKLIQFLRGAVPKITDFGEALNRDVRDCPNFADILTDGGRELNNLATETDRPPQGGGESPPRLNRPAPTESMGPARNGGAGADRPGWCGGTAPGPLPEFLPAFLDSFPSTGCRLGDYELRSVLGSGGVGVVFKGYEPSLNRFVAVKMLSLDTGTGADARDRFAREARACAAIRHENVITVYAVREAVGLPYLVMEYVEGVTLDEYIEENKIIPLATVLEIAHQTALGLAAAHKKGIVHRDIKPGNIILEKETGAVKIADFGLSRSACDPSRSQPGMVAGTPHFMSPEQVGGEIATPVSDLFSLGGVLYALCTGHPPFGGAHVLAILCAVTNTDPAPLSKYRPDVPPWLEEIVMRLLHKDPARRFSSAAELAAVLAAKMALSDR